MRGGSNKYFRNLGMNLDSHGQIGKYGHPVYDSLEILQLLAVTIQNQMAYY